MATVTRPRERRGGWKDTDRRVRHPLQAVRRYIRRYVILEGLGLTLLYLSLAFWLGFAFDWGLFHIPAFRFDWIESFQNATKNSGIDFYVRGLILTVVVLGLAAVAVTKTLLRLFGEFSDRSMALLLERRFPRQLGDRLITAVELADPRKSERYGFSLPLTEKTIRDAAERVESVPVRRVFNWRRLRWIWAFCLLLTVVLYALIGTAFCLIRWVGPMDFALRFNDAASIWVDRNVLLNDIYWPREAYLEVLGFEPSRNNKNAMRVGSGEQRENLRVRALKWIMGDRSVPGGWRPIQWKDLDACAAFEQGRDVAVLKELSEQVKLEIPWDGWALDGDDRRGDWRDWSMDQLWRQSENGDVRVRMAELHYDMRPEVAYLGMRVDESGLPLPVSATVGVGLAGLLPNFGALAAWSGPVAIANIPMGVKIKGLVADGPAHKAGFKVGDLVTDVGDVRVTDLDSMRTAILENSKDRADRFAVKVLRDGDSVALNAGPLRESNPLGMSLATVEKRTPAGARITGLAKGSPADNAGLAVGDVVTEVRGQKITDVKSLDAALQAPAATDLVEFKVRRGDKAERRQVDGKAINGSKLFNSVDAVRVDRVGAEITAVADGGLAARARLMKGDVIVSADGRDVEDVEAMLAAVKTHRSGDFPVSVVRDGKTVDCKLEVARLPLEQIFDRLRQLAAEPGMGRLITEKQIPSSVTVYWTDKSAHIEDAYVRANNRYNIGLGSPQQTTVFRVRGLDFYTPFKTIIVAPPPSLASLLVDRLEPAYVFYRLKGDQEPLKGVKRVSTLDELNRTGVSLVKVAAGSDVVLRAALDTSEGRKLQDVALRPVKDRDRREGEAADIAAMPRAEAEVNDDKTSFTLELKKVDTTYDFVIEFRDEDKAVGQRRVRVEVYPDRGPTALLGVESENYLRRPRMRGQNVGELPAEAGGSWLITPNAVLPLKAVLQDDFGLTDGNYVVQLEPFQIEFFVAPGAKTNAKPDVKPEKKPETDKKAALPAGSARKFLLTLPLRDYMPSFKDWQDGQTSVTLDDIEEFNGLDAKMMKLFRAKNYSAAISRGEDLLALRKRKLKDHVDVARTLRLLGEMHEAKGDKDDARFRMSQAENLKLVRGVELQSVAVTDDFKLTDVRAVMEAMRKEALKKGRPNQDIPTLPTEDAAIKLHYMMYMTVEVTDNNVETGPATTRGKTPVKFLIVSESEFLLQVGEEQELLAKRLEDAYKSLDKSRIRLGDLLDVLKTSKANYELISTRNTRAQRMLLDAAALTRDVSRDFDRIEKHLEFNKGPSGQMFEEWKKVRDKIAGPLHDLVSDGGGDKNFPTVEAILKKRLDAAEEQRTAGNNDFLPPETVAGLLRETADSHRRVQELMDELNGVVVQILEVVAYDRLKIDIERMAKEQKDRAEEMRRIAKEEEDRLLDFLKVPPKK